MGNALKVGSGIALGCVLGFGIASWKLASRAEAPALPAAEQAQGGDGFVDAQGHSRFALLARQAGPGVVNVHTSRTVTQGVPGFPFPDVFGEFFGQPGPPGPQPQPREFQVPSLGSGFVLSADGDIVTNSHVVEGVDEIRIVFADGSEAEASVIGSDPKTDLALLRVEGRSDLHALPLGDSDALLPGDWVVAIGNPFGLDHTVTAGIVSAKGRDIGQGPYDDFIQTDAAINPGNSGGPLLNLAGEVVGINSAINPEANTIGFAVPINLAKEILPQLKQTGSVTRGWLGVGVQPLTPELVESFGLENAEGALVSQVMPGSPAEQGGVERGDVIVAYDGQPIREMRDLPRRVSATAPGREVRLEVLRKGRPTTVEVTIGTLEEEAPQATARAGGGGLRGLGLRVQDLTPALRQRLGVEAEAGAVVVQVDPGGPAAAAGLRPGDVVLEVGREPVRDAADLEAKLEAAGAKLLLLVQRGGETFYVPLERPS